LFQTYAAVCTARTKINSEFIRVCGGRKGWDSNPRTGKPRPWVCSPLAKYHAARYAISVSGPHKGREHLGTRVWTAASGGENRIALASEGGKIRDVHRSGGDLEATTGFEPVIRVLQTLALTTWPRRRIGAGDGIRTRDLLLGKEMLYP
jgi:hypothetical protein